MENDNNSIITRRNEIQRHNCYAEKKNKRNMEHNLLKMNNEDETNRMKTKFMSNKPGDNVYMNLL